MKHFALDASALVKRYHDEPGSEIVQTLTENLLANEPRQALISWPVLAETLASLTRKKNSNAIPDSVYQAVRTRLLLDARQMTILVVTDLAIRDSINLIERHNLNASDALFLRQVLDWLAQLPEDDQVVVIAGDRRLLRAAEVEGLAGLDPEQSDPSDVKTLLTTV